MRIPDAQVARVTCKCVAFDKHPRNSSNYAASSLGLSKQQSHFVVYRFVLALRRSPRRRSGSVRASTVGVGKQEAKWPQQRRCEVYPDPPQHRSRCALQTRAETIAKFAVRSQEEGE